MRTAIISLVLATTALTLLAGCSSGTGSGTTSTDTTTTAPSATLPAYGAPKVDNPLDTAKYQQSPCSVLTAAQLQALNNHGAPRASNFASGPSCQWDDSTSGASLTVSFYTARGVSNGLSGAYSDKQAFQLFQPTQIDGYPAVDTNRQDPGNQGQCETGVGVADDMQVGFSVDLYTTDPNYATACSVAEKFATSGVTTMKSGS